MLKSLVRAALAAALVLSAGAAVAQEAPAAQDRPVRVAVVDLDLLVARSTAGQELRNKLAEFEKQAKAEGEKLAAEARDIRQLIADGANSLSEDRLAELQKDYEDKTIAIRRFQDDKQRQGQKMQDEGLKKIETDLRPIFDLVQEEGDYDLILNRVPGVVVMASERVDITARVLELYDAAVASSGG